MSTSNLITKRIWRNYPSFLITEDRRSIIHSLTEAIRYSIELSEEGIRDASLMMYLETATGEYLDAWGEAFGIIRASGEDDDAYRQRILFELTALRQTKEGLQKIAAFYSKTLTEHEVVIFEPHTELHALSGQFRINRSIIPGYRYWTWAIIDIQTSRELSEEVKRHLEASKAFGIKIQYTIYHPSTVGREEPVGTIHLKNQESVMHIESYCPTREVYTLSWHSGRLNGGGIAI